MSKARRLIKFVTPESFADDDERSTYWFEHVDHKLMSSNQLFTVSQTVDGVERVLPIKEDTSSATPLYYIEIEPGYPVEFKNGQTGSQPNAKIWEQVTTYGFSVLQRGDSLFPAFFVLDDELVADDWEDGTLEVNLAYLPALMVSDIDYQLMDSKPMMLSRGGEWPGYLTPEVLSEDTNIVFMPETESGANVSLTCVAIV